MAAESCRHAVLTSPAQGGLCAGMRPPSPQILMKREDGGVCRSHSVPVVVAAAGHKCWWGTDIAGVVGVSLPPRGAIRYGAMGRNVDSPRHAPPRAALSTTGLAAVTEILKRDSNCFIFPSRASFGARFVFLLVETVSGRERIYMQMGWAFKRTRGSRSGVSGGPI